MYPVRFSYRCSGNTRPKVPVPPKTDVCLLYFFAPTFILAQSGMSGAQANRSGVAGVQLRVLLTAGKSENVTVPTETESFLTLASWGNTKSWYVHLKTKKNEKVSLTPVHGYQPTTTTSSHWIDSRNLHRIRQVACQDKVCKTQTRRLIHATHIERVNHLELHSRIRY